MTITADCVKMYIKNQPCFLHPNFMQVFEVCTEN